MPPHGVPTLPLKNEAHTPHPLPPEKQTPPPLKNEVPFQKMISRKKYPKNWKLPFNIYVSLIKQHWKKLAEIPQKRDFLTCSIQNFTKKPNSLLEIIILLD